jgi:hypothetical protein
MQAVRVPLGRAVLTRLLAAAAALAFSARATPGSLPVLAAKGMLPTAALAVFTTYRMTQELLVQQAPRLVSAPEAAARARA